jgi:hypothetical protein
MARPRKPLELKIIQGSRRLDNPGVTLPPVAAVPTAPDWLPNAAAVREWKRLAALLTATRILAEADLATLGHLCAVHGKIVQLWAAGEAPTGHLLAQHNALAAAFGLAPAWRARVRPSDPPRDNPFSRFRK